MRSSFYMLMLVCATLGAVARPLSHQKLDRRAGSSQVKEAAKAAVKGEIARLGVNIEPPPWWPTYAPYASQKIPDLFHGNQVYPERLRNFKQRLEALEIVRNYVLHHNRGKLTVKEEQLFMRPLNLNHWRNFEATEGNPHNIHRATLLFQQDSQHLELMDRTIALLFKRP